MSDDRSDAPKPPVKKPRAKKPPTGRPRGRPPKSDELLVNSQVRRTLLEILDEEIEIRTPAGTRKVSKFHTVFQNLVTNAAKGNPTSLNHLMRLLIPVLREREQAHPQVWLAEALREMSESPDPDKQVSHQQVRAQILAAKNKY
jgi:hypothetical protein